MKIYLDWNDWWIGWYRGPRHHYVCPVPVVVIRWNRNPERRARRHARVRKPGPG